MKLNLARFLGSARKRLRDVVGVDIGSTGIKVVRVRIGEHGPLLTGAALLPPLHPAPTDALIAKHRRPALILPRELRARWNALAISPPDAIAKLLVVPRAADKLGDFGFAELLGLPNADTHRIGVEVQSSTYGETTVLAAALPETMALWCLRLLPSATSASCSLELSGLAALNAIAFSQRDKALDSACMALDVGAQTSTLGIFVKNELALVRQFAIGSQMVLKCVAEALGMDEETASSVLGDGVIDATDAVRTALDPLIHQLVIGRDFVARRKNCRINELFLTGGLFGSAFWRTQLADTLNITAAAWNPLAIIPASPAAAVLADNPNASAFAAAMGVALAALEAS